LEDPVAEEILKGNLANGEVILADYSGEGDSLTVSRVAKVEEVVSE
jgi:ATP-dependent Clp protease ATP-binding subunit ClpC